MEFSTGGPTTSKNMQFNSFPFIKNSQYQFSYLLKPSVFRLDHCRRAPLTVSRMMTHCWHSDPAMRPSFDNILTSLAAFMSKTDKQSYEARCRLDTASMGMMDSGLADMLHAVSTPSTGTTSKSSTRSRTVSKCSELSWLPSSSSSQVELSSIVTIQVQVMSVQSIPCPPQIR